MRVVSMHEQVTEVSRNTWEVTVRERERERERERLGPSSRNHQRLRKDALAYKSN